MLEGRSAPSLSCNRNEKNLLFEDTRENDRSLDLSGLVIFGSDGTNGPETNICFKNIQINSARMTVRDIKMSSQLRLGCQSKRQNLAKLASGKKSLEKGKMIVRQRWLFVGFLVPQNKNPWNSFNKSGKNVKKQNYEIQ